MKTSDFLIGFASAAALVGAAYAGKVVLDHQATSSATSRSTMTMAPNASPISVPAPPSKVARGTDNETHGDNSCPGGELVFHRDDGTGWNCEPIRLARSGAATISSELTAEQAHAVAQADSVADQLEVQADMIEAAQRACGGRWQFAGSADQVPFTLEIKQLGFVLRQTQGAKVVGTAEPTDKDSVMLSTTYETDDPITRDHVLQCRGSTAVFGGMRDQKDLELTRM